MPSSKFKVLWKGPMPLKQLNSLVCLYLSECRDLKRLPEQLGEIKGLKMIDVSVTAIERLPDSVTHLKKLILLNLRFCKKLKNLPEQIGEMKGLKELDARFSAIEKLPNSITQLRELFRLSLFGCKNLRNIPEQIGNIESLRMFEAGGIAVEQLPDSFGGLINLERLNLFQCKNLRNLPDSIWKLKLLKQLYLGECPKLERLPEKLGEMKCLEYLDADGTAIKKVPDSIRLLSRLQVLNLDDCKKLKYVPEGVWNLTSVERLYLEAGDMGTISLPDSVENLNKLKTLHLSCNVRLCLPMILNFPSLERLTLTDEGQILSSAEAAARYCPFSSQLPNREVAEWFDYKSGGHTVSFDIPPISGSNFLGLALWLVYTCKPTHLDSTYIRAVISNKMESITANCRIHLHPVGGEAESSVQCIRGEKIPVKSGDRVKVTFGSLMYCCFNFKDDDVLVGEVKVKMCGVHVIQD
ncbi:hypothetical protein ACET3Z_008822 [Daucus carota]